MQPKDKIVDNTTKNILAFLKTSSVVFTASISILIAVAIDSRVSASDRIPPELRNCAAISDPKRRLRCYDGIVRPAATPPLPPRQPAQRPVRAPEPAIAAPTQRHENSSTAVRIEAGVGFHIASVDAPFDIELLGDPVELAFTSFLGGRGPTGKLTFWYDGIFHPALSLGVSYGHARLSGDADADFPAGFQVIADPILNDISYKARMDSLMLGLSATIFATRRGSSFVTVEAGVARLELESTVRTDSPLLVAPQISRNSDTVLTPIWSLATGYRLHFGPHLYSGIRFGLNGVNGGLFGQDGKAYWGFDAMLFTGYRF